MSCKGHYMVKLNYRETPNGQQVCVLTRFGTIKAVHLKTDAQDICLVGREMLFWVKGLFG
jgi:hypothetical protein